MFVDLGECRLGYNSTTAISSKFYSSADLSVAVSRSTVPGYSTLYIGLHISLMLSDLDFKLTS